MKKAFYFLNLIFLIFSACQGVNDLFNPKHPPQLSEEGVVVSQDQVMPQDTILAQITATNPLDGPLEFTWYADGGNFIPPTDQDSVFWIAPVKGGLYHLWVTVGNLDGTTESPKRQILVVSTSKPVVNILHPSENAYFTVGQTIGVDVKAEHANGIALVNLYVNGRLQAKSDQAANQIYTFQLTLDDSMVGKTVLKAEAIARNQMASKGTDSITILVGGIVAGGNEQR